MKMKIPRDLVVSMTVLFGETYMYFLFSYLLMPYLVEQVGVSDIHSGIIYAAFGGVLLFMTIVFGSLIDKLLLRRTLQLQLLVGMVSMWMLALSENVFWTCLVLFLPMSFALSIGLPALPVAVRRYTTPRWQTLGFGVLFVVVNLGTALAQVSADVFRLYVLPYSGTATLVYLPAHSVLFAIMSLPHFVNYVLVTVFLRDVYVSDEEWTLKRVERAPTHSSGARVILKQRLFWYFVLLSLATTGAKSVYRYLDSLYPLYMQRGQFPVDNPEAMPYMTLLLLNPILACILTPLFSYVVTRFDVHPFDIILLGSAISAGAPFIMTVVRYWAVIVFVTVLTVGEALWAPMLQRYTNDFCEPGTEGMFFALATIPLFAAKIISGSLSGFLLDEYCPGHANCDAGWFIWVIVGCITVSSPLLLLATCRCTRLKR